MDSLIMETPTDNSKTANEAADNAELVRVHLLNIEADARVVFEIGDALDFGAGERELSDQTRFRCLVIAAKSIEDSARQALELLDEG